MKIQVDIPPEVACDPAPARFRLGAHSIEVVDVVDRWRGREADHFRVLGSDGHTYVLRWTRASDHRRTWELVSFTHKDSLGSSLHPAAGTTRLQ
jgi:hypothetical protein